MPIIAIRQLTTDDYPRVLELNDIEVAQTSVMDVEKLVQLVAFACYAKVATCDDRLIAFLLALPEGQPYDNANYAFFASRFARFVYVDRIVVDGTYKGMRVGGTLYEDLFTTVRSQGVSHVTCEYNLIPANPASKKFHDKFGFVEIGQQWLAAGAKLVSLQAAVVN